MNISKYLFAIVLFGSLIAGGCPLMCGMTPGVPPPNGCTFDEVPSDDFCPQYELNCECGDGIVHEETGEECDAGAANGAVPPCGIPGSSCTYCSEDCKSITLGGEIPPPPGS